MKNLTAYSSSQTIWHTLLRITIGWHFLYEGLVKLLNPGWSALPYLMDSQGIFSPCFNYIALNPTLLSISDQFNIYGLTLVGLFLILGCFERIAIIGGISFLGLYYLSHPPFIGAEYMMPSEGSYLWIDKNIIEIVALCVLFCFPTSRLIGLDRYIFKFISKK